MHVNFMHELSYYLSKEILGTKAGDWAAWLSSVGVFFSYLAYCKKHPDVFDKIKKTFKFLGYQKI